MYHIENKFGAVPKRSLKPLQRGSLLCKLWVGGAIKKRIGETLDMTGLQRDLKRETILQVMRDRMLPGAMVRSICDRVYGSRISSEAWRNWREWADVPKHKRAYSFEQFCFLYAVASIRSNEFSRYRQLRSSEIRKISESIETQEMLAKFVEFFDTDLIVGKDAPIALAARGVRVSLKTLYKNVPGFSTGKIYQVEHLRFWAVA